MSLPVSRTFEVSSNVFSCDSEIFFYFIICFLTYHKVLYLFLQKFAFQHCCTPLLLVKVRELYIKVLSLLLLLAAFLTYSGDTSLFETSPVRMPAANVLHTQHKNIHLYKMYIVPIRKSTNNNHKQEVNGIWLMIWQMIFPLAVDCVTPFMR